jgi:exodeoxyribonuclease III
VKIATWNVNSIRARENVVLDWLEANDPDLLMMQETKIPDQEFPEDGFGDLDYDVVYYGQQTYNGVAIASHREVQDVVRGLPGDDELAERRLIAGTVEGIRIICVYVPNGRQLGSASFRFKLVWLDRLHAFLEATVRPDQPVVLAGDFNIAPCDDDVWDVARYQGALFCSEEERSRFRRLIEWGFVDMVRHLDPTPRRFTWWDYRAGSWQKNHGLRIDHVLVTKPILERTRAITIDRDVRAGLDPSDHVPVTISLDDA